MRVIPQMQHKAFLIIYNHTIKPFLLLSLLVAMQLAASGSVYSQPSSDLFKDDPDVPWDITADEVNYNSKNRVYTAHGNVVIQKQNKKLIADHVIFDNATMKAAASGHVVMTTGEDVVSGDALDLNLSTETGTLKNGSIFIRENHFYIKGTLIEKTGENTYRAKKASVTSCKGDSPAWKITGRNLKVTIEGYGSVTHAALWAKKLPVLYTPYLLFPVKTKRQTGLLAPGFGFSDRKGAEFIQPLFWAINDSSDATFYAHYMSDRGEKLGVEYRYVLDEYSKGTIMVDGFKDNKIDDGTGDSTYGYTGDAYTRTNTDRYWFRMKHDQDLPDNFKAKLDLDIVSDQDYLQEFNDGYTGFTKTRDYYESTFNRDLDPYEENTRLNQLNISRTWSSFSLNTYAQWNDNVVKRRWSQEDDTVQKLPRIDFDGSKQEILTSNIYYDIESEYTYFYRQDGDRGQRIDLYPRVYYPMKFKNYFSLEPSIGWRETAWRMDKAPGAALKDQHMSREIYDAQVDMSTEFSRVFDASLFKIDKIRHAVTPGLTYNYTPDLDQSKYPDFDDELDVISPENTVTWSLTSTFTSRSLPATAQGKTETTHKKPDLYSYNRFCRIYLEQSYDITKHRDDDPEPFSDISGELDLSMGAYVTIDADAKWDPYDEGFNAHNVALSLHSKRGDALTAEHRYEKNSVESIVGSAEAVLTDRLTARFSYERNLLTEKDITKSAGFLYKAGCWSLDLNFIEEESDQKVAFVITLYGIGAFGK